MKHDGERKTGNDRTRKYQVREMFSFRDITSFKVKGFDAKKKKKLKWEKQLKKKGQVRRAEFSTNPQTMCKNRYHRTSESTQLPQTSVELSGS